MIKLEIWHIFNVGLISKYRWDRSKFGIWWFQPFWLAVLIYPRGGSTITYLPHDGVKENKFFSWWSS
jgi:hypothetical protein